MKTSLMLRAKHETYNDVRKLYFAGTYTQNEIAEITSVPRSTLRNWIKVADYDFISQQIGLDRLFY